MDWKLTKNYMILFLIILNIILFTANFFSKKDYKITNLQEESILKYANENNVEINAKISKNFYPMNSISMKKVQHNEIILQEIFFGTSENIKKYIEYDTRVFKKDEKLLLIDNNLIIFKDFEENSNYLYNKDNVLKDANKIKDTLSKYYGKMNLDTIIKMDNYYQISFIQKIKKYKNFSNFLNIKIYENGEKLIYFNYFEEIEKLNELKNICSPDEAIYTFINEITRFFPKDKIKINKIDLGYYWGNNENIYEYILKPYYRIYLEGFDIPFYINAYTNNFEIDLNFTQIF